jgi:hypothetical protein
MPNKYHAQRVTIDGHNFHSKREADHYLYLKGLLQDGEIAELKLQPKFILQQKFNYKGKTIQKMTYAADFSYIEIESGNLVIVDVKGYETQLFKAKWKLMQYRFRNDENVELRKVR